MTANKRYAAAKELLKETTVHKRVFYDRHAAGRSLKVMFFYRDGDRAMGRVAAKLVRDLTALANEAYGHKGGYGEMRFVFNGVR